MYDIQLFFCFTLVIDCLVLEGLKSPTQFPNGERILKLVPQIVSTINAQDVHGNPLAVEQYGFNPHEVLAELRKEEYITFVIYTLEYKALFLEQVSETREKEFLKLHNDSPPFDPNGYGVLVQHCIIRDFKGFSITAGLSLKKVLEWILPIALDNYPEMMFKSHMINMPFGFTTVFNFINLFLDPR